MDLSVWITYLVATVILSVSPGPGVFSSLAAGLNHGFRRGMWNAVGMQVANFALQRGQGRPGFFQLAHFAFNRSLDLFGLAHLLVQCRVITNAAQFSVNSSKLVALR